MESKALEFLASSFSKFTDLFGYSFVSQSSIEAYKSTIARLHAENDKLLNSPSVDFLSLLKEPVPSPALPPQGIYTPIFSYDGLINDPKVIHNHDFMRDERFIKAYKAANQALALDHKMFWRLHVALWCASQAQRLDGHFVECGVWRGFLPTAIMNYIEWPSKNKQFFLFDTWNGLDDQYLTESERANQEKLNHLNAHYADQFDFAKKHFASYANVNLIRGSVPETLNSAEIPKVAYLSLDLNCVTPELAAAEFFWPRIVPGGMILLDDYGFVSYEDQKRGFDAFASAHGIEILALPTGQGLIIKV